MLNGTLISVTHMLTPLWSEQITKFFLLDNRYCTVFTLLFNGMTTMITMSEKTAMNVLIAVFLLVAFYIGFFKKQTMHWFSFRSNKKSFDFQMQFSNESTFLAFKPTILEIFLYENSEFFVKSMPRWLSGYNSIVVRNQMPSIDADEAFLNNGFYHVKFSDEIYFTITVSLLAANGDRKHGIRNVSVEFIRGDENAMFSFMKETNEKKNVTTDKSILLFPLDIEIGSLDNLSETKGKRSTFFGYYNPKLDMLIDWIDSLQQPSKCRQPRQFSILCHGKSGTGKTALVKRMAEYTSRTIVCVDLLGVKEKRELMNLFYNGNYYGDVGNLIFFIDEFDKVIRKFKLLEEEKKKKHQSSVVVLKQQKMKDDDDGHSSSKTKDDDKEADYDWDIDSLLDIFCGSYIPDQRMIVATCNDLDYILSEYPYLARPGRLTPIKFDHGKRDLFLRIVKDYTNIVLNKKDIPEDYVFVQAHLIEFLNFKVDVTEEEIVKNLPMFRVK